jgi:DNA-binding beta-propeller fold protein YncE
MRRPSSHQLTLRASRATALLVAATLALGVALVTSGEASAAEGPPIEPGLRSVLFVGNNHDGTADIVDPHTFERLGRMDMIPDIDERMEEIVTDPERLAFFLLIRQFIGEGNDQYVDDMFTSHDGRVVYVSRPSLADVVAIDLETGDVEWRIPMDGQRSDHMAISPDGSHLLVSDSTERQVIVIDPVAGERVATFESGDTPHENEYSEDGSRIFHASIGLVYTPLDQPQLDTTKGDRWFQVVDADTNEVIQRLDVGELLEEQGYGDDHSSAVRPMALTPDERTVYLQISFFHGFLELDLETETITRMVDLPTTDETPPTREQYVLDSAHHGIAMNPEGTKLCIAGTMSGYAAIVDVERDLADIEGRGELTPTMIDVGPKPYWSTNSADGRYCFVSVSGNDEVVVIEYASEQEVARFEVGDHPQRMRMGVVAAELVAGLPGGDDEATPEEASRDTDGGADADQEDRGESSDAAANDGASGGPSPEVTSDARPTLPATGGGLSVLGLVLLASVLLGRSTWRDAPRPGR